jgi:amino-acid N-acetyltransferase
LEDLVFSPAAPPDLPDIVALLERCGLPTQDLGAAHLQHFIVCRAGARLAGTVGLEPLGDVALLRSLAVAPEQRGRRIACELWQRARDHALQRGVARLYLLTTTAEALFARWGFRRVPRDHAPGAVRGTAEWSRLCPDTAAVMTADLGAEHTRPPG